MFATFTSVGLVRGGSPSASGLSERSISHDDRVLLEVPGAVPEPLPQVVIDRGSALRLVDPASATVLSTDPARLTSSSGLAPRNAASGVPAQEQ